MMPHAREDGLVVQELPDETLVYDLNRHRAHCLNRTAALVWQYCDGRTTVAEMAKRIHNEMHIPADEEVVWLALDRLGKAHLLREGMTPPADAARYSRREILRNMVLVGGLSIVLPVVTSIVAPTAVQAATCVLGCLGVIDCTPCGNACSKRCKGGDCKSRAVSGCP